MPRLSIWGNYALLLFLVPLIGFPLHAILQPEALPPMRFVLHLHAVSAGFWFMLVIAQSFLMSKRNYKLHAKLGWWSIALAILVALSGVIITQQFYERTGNFHFYFGSLISFGMFGLFYVLGILRRKDKAFHKRIMIFATISLMPAATNRFAFIFGLDPSLSGPIWIALAALVPIYDLVTLRRITMASVVGIAVWAAMLVSMANFAHG